MTMLHKDFGLEIKAVSDAGVIEGYGSVFGGAPDSYGDVIAKGAFANTIASHKAAGTMPLMLWGHNASELPIGDWTDMAEDRKGLWMQGQLDMEDPVSVRVHRAMSRKSVRGLSIGYETIKSSEDPKKPTARLLEEVNLWEVSPCNFPANRRAQITSVKSFMIGGELPTVREFEGLLRDAGFSKAKAAAIAAAATPHLQGDPEEVDPMAQFWALMRAAPIIDSTGE